MRTPRNTCETVRTTWSTTTADVWRPAPTAAQRFARALLARARLPSMVKPGRCAAFARATPTLRVAKRSAWVLPCGPALRRPALGGADGQTGNSRYTAIIFDKLM
jgi:hypothetical protein